VKFSVPDSRTTLTGISGTPEATLQLAHTSEFELQYTMALLLLLPFTVAAAPLSVTLSARGLIVKMEDTCDPVCMAAVLRLNR